MLLRRSLIFGAAVLAQIVLSSVCFGYSTDELIGRATNVTTSLARGNVSGAASQAIGGYSVPVARGSNLYLSPGGVGFQQGIKPLGMSNRYMNVGTNYNASVNPLHPTNVSQNVSVNSGTPYFSNSTVIPVPANVKRNN